MKYSITYAIILAEGNTMNIESDRQNIIILKAFEALTRQVKLSNKNNFEKEALILLIGKVRIYYLNRLEIIKNCDIEKLYTLQSYITDVFVDINNSLLDNANTFDYIGKINEKLHDHELSHLVSKHKYLSYKLG